MELGLTLLAGHGGRAAAAIYATLILLALIALAGLTLPRGVFRPRQISAWLADSAEQRRADAERRTTAATESIRYAEEISVAAQGATNTAERRRDECQEAQSRTQQAWQAYQDADAALTRARRAAAYALPALSEGADGANPGDRAQALRRSAQAAYRRGDLSDTQLLDALTHRNGWDPALHPVDQELILARAAVVHRFTAYQECLTAEDAAWLAADIATASVRSLRNEVIAAQARAETARLALPPQARPARAGRRVTAAA